MFRAEQDNLVLGLDIGTTKVCAVAAEMGDGRLPKVVGVGVSECHGLKKGAIVDLDSTTSAIESAVATAEQIAGADLSEAIVGISGDHIASQNSRSIVAIRNLGGEILPSDVERLLEESRVIVLPPDREIIHSIPRWYSVDGHSGVRSPVGMCGSRLEMETHIVTGLSSFIRNVVKCAESAGLSVEATVFQPIAAAESVLLKPEKELGVALLDIGGGTSDLAIYVDGQVCYSASIPVGGNYVTKDIAVGLRTSLEEAERIKLAYGCALQHGNDGARPFEFESLASDKPRHLPRGVLAQIIEPRLTEILQFALDHIEKSGCVDRIPAGLVLTGGGSQIEGMLELAESVTGMHTRAGVPGYGFTGSVDTLRNPAYATAAGLVLFWKLYYDGSTDGHRGFVLPSVFGKLRELVARIGMFGLQIN